MNEASLVLEELVSALENCVPQLGTQGADQGLGPEEISLWLEERQYWIDRLLAHDMGSTPAAQKLSTTERIMAVLQRDQVLVNCLVHARDELGVQLENVTRARGAVRGYRAAAPPEPPVARRSA